MDVIKTEQISATRGSGGEIEVDLGKLKSFLFKEEALFIRYEQRAARWIFGQTEQGKMGFLLFYHTVSLKMTPKQSQKSSRSGKGGRTGLGESYRMGIEGRIVGQQTHHPVLRKEWGFQNSTFSTKTSQKWT